MAEKANYLTDAETARRAWATATAPLKGYVIVQAYPTTGGALIGEQYGKSGPLASFDEAVRDIYEAQVEDVARVVFIDELAGVIRDASAEVARWIVVIAEVPLCEPAFDFCEEYTTVPAHLRPDYEYTGPSQAEIDRRGVAR